MALGSVIIALSTLANPAEYGIPAAAVPYIRLAALIATVLGAKMGNSPLPGVNESKRGRR